MGVGGIFIRDDNTRISDVAVTLTVGVGEEVCIGTGEGVSVCVGVDSTGVAVIKKLAAFTGVDEHPLSRNAVSVRRIIK
jgi:hypothetical protein